MYIIIFLYSYAPSNPQRVTVRKGNAEIVNFVLKKLPFQEQQGNFENYYYEVSPFLNRFSPVQRLISSLYDEE
jgi:hypothetical protein